jgi:hypothetical protein
VGAKSQNEDTQTRGLFFKYCTKTELWNVFEDTEQKIVFKVKTESSSVEVLVSIS